MAGAAAAASPAFGFPRPGRARAAPDRPNVLMIMVDDLRPELGCYGVREIQTPNIDRLAAEGVRFERAYCSQAICNPARSSLLTGLRPDTLRVWDNETHFRRFHPEILTIPQAFKIHGYQNVGLGKVFHGTLPDQPSWSRRRLPPTPLNIYMSAETRDRQSRRASAARALGLSQAWIDAYVRGPATEIFDAPDNAYWDGALAQAGVSLLADLRDKQPFFLAVGFMRPHLPYVAPRRYWDLYGPRDIPPAPNPFLPEDAPPFAINSLTEVACFEDFVEAPNPTEGRLGEDQARRLKHGYYACVSFIDAQAGRILDALATLGIRENTIVVMLGDNGYKLGEHGAWGKMTNYEIDARFPMIIAAPGRTVPGGVVRGLAEGVDLYPTLCELAGLEAPPDLEGISLAPLLREPERPWKTAAFTQYPRGFTSRFMGRAIRTDRHRFIEWRDRFDDRLAAVELYDHAVDPQENVNVAGRLENRALVADLSTRLAAGWRAASISLPSELRPDGRARKHVAPRRL